VTSLNLEWGGNFRENLRSFCNFDVGFLLPNTTLAGRILSDSLIFKLFTEYLFGYLNSSWQLVKIKILPFYFENTLNTLLI
jgi:hypothetical protein